MYLFTDLLKGKMPSLALCLGLLVVLLVSKVASFSPNAGRCIVQILSSVPTKGLRADDVPALTDRVRQAMLVAFEGLSADLGPPQ